MCNAEYKLANEIWIQPHILMWEHSDECKDTFIVDLLAVYAYPSCLQTTVASMLSQESSHTVPHWSLMHTSTLPSYWLEPPTRRTSPYIQLPLVLTIVNNTYSFVALQRLHYRYLNLPWHLTPASSVWPPEQMTAEACEQCVRLFSLPVHSTLSRWIAPTPALKWAWLKAIAPVGIRKQQ